MTYVRDIMSSFVIAIKETATIDAGIDLMISNGISGLPVVNEQGSLVGVISEYDVLQLYVSGGASGRGMEPCSEFMNRKLRTIQADATIDAAVAVFRASHLRRLIVLEKEKLVGVLSRRDIIRDIREQRAGADKANVARHAEFAGTRRI